MRRLLQGDVGSGKTIVAMQAALVAIEKRPPGSAYGAHRNPCHPALPQRAQAARGQAFAHHRQALQGHAAHRFGRRSAQARSPHPHRHRPHRPGHRHAGAHPVIGRVPQPRPGHCRRAASLRRAAALQADEGRRPRCKLRDKPRPRRPRHDRNPHPPHPRPHRLRRHGRLRARRTTPRPYPPSSPAAPPRARLPP